MKALSLKQPWAELVLQGKKTIETRTWNTSFRGEFFIHASGNVDVGAMQKFDFKDLPLRAIVGKAVLVAVKEYTTRTEWDADEDKHLAKGWWDGKKRFGFVLKDVQRVPVRHLPGKMGFFDV